MKSAIILLIFMTVCFVGQISAQECTELGQNPGTAFPVCGTQEFKQNEVKLCGTRKIAGPCTYELITDKNPYWYKFTCYISGTLGLLITPVTLTDDYDWQLFDITGKDANSVYSDKSTFVACNWSGEAGQTGASNAGTSLTVCEGFGKPLFSSMPNIIQGHEYLLLVSHFTDSQSGYSLAFGGGTAGITDSKIPAMDRAYASCKGTEVYIRLNKDMKCSSLASDGSDFSLPSGLPNVISAASPRCSSGFTTDTIVLTLDQSLPSGDFILNLKSGSDGNTLLDNCGNQMPAGTIGFRVNENVSASFTYQLKEGCKQDTVNFFHDGLHQVNSWTWQFDDAVSTNQNPVMLYSSGGNKNVRLTVSNNFCTDTASATVSIAEKMNAAFAGPEIICYVDDAIFTDYSSGPIDVWQWDFGNGHTSLLKDPERFKYASIGIEKTYRVTLNISNAAGCTDSTSANIVVAGNCNITVPSAFTPNNDGRNDYLFPTNAFNADNLDFRIYNRFGQIIFETKNWQKKWDGNVNGQPQSTGTYVWTLSYTLKSTGKRYNVKGATVLIR